MADLVEDARSSGLWTRTVSALYQAAGLRDEALFGRGAALLNMGQLAEGETDVCRALAMAREIGHPTVELLALGTLSWAVSSAAELIRGLDWCGHLCAATGRFADAVTVWSAFLRHGQFLNWPADARRRDDPLREARRALGPARARAAEERGATMSPATVAEYALMLTDSQAPEPAAPGPGKLSARERELVTLVAQGRTNAQIAAQLYISIRTVSSHLDRIRDKTGCRRRADLARLALSTGLV